MKRRAAISKAELAKVREMLELTGSRIATVDIQPGRVTITTTDAEDVALWDRVADRERAKERWPS